MRADEACFRLTDGPFPMGVSMRVAAALALIVALVSGAQAGTTIYKLATVCKWDKEQYCKDIPFKKARDLKACLAKHEKDLLPQCQDHYKEAN
jgi:hypothetical protein